MAMESIKEKFEIIRPYKDSEVKEAIGRLTEDPRFGEILTYLYDGSNLDELISLFKSIETIDEFQIKFSGRAVQRIIDKTSSGFSYGGLDKLDPNVSYLFVANHRDIVLDSAIMQLVLVSNGHKTSEITFGSNLMSSQFVVDLGKINKMFTLYRGGTRIEQYKNALLHSAYIHHSICNKNESIWIAQRDGRTKDGSDKTQVGLLKMFSLGHKDVCTRLKDLNIVPLTISYEYEPCDSSKAREIYIKGEGAEYVKHPNEDLESVIHGIRGYKGKVHMEFGEPLNNFIEELAKEESDANEKIAKIAEEIDRQIYLNYQLNAINYIAYDLMMNSSRYKDKYNSKEVLEFENYISKKVEKIEGDPNKLREYFLKIYGNPVANYLSVK